MTPPNGSLPGRTPRSRPARRPRRIVIVVAVVAVLLLLAWQLTPLKGYVSQSLGTATLGSVALTAPSSVAIGAASSLYVIDNGRLLHLSANGDLLQRLGPADSGVATDRRGDAYVVSGGRLRVVAPSGTLLQQWQVGDATEVTVDGQGDVYIANSFTPANDASGEDHYHVRRYSPSGLLLGRWDTAFGRALTAAGGYLYGVDAMGDTLAQLAPMTGKALARWAGNTMGVMSFDDLAADRRGLLYLGATTSGNPPFAIQTMTRTGAKYAFNTVNTAEEQVAGLAIDAQGNIYVIRNSYARPCNSNLGLDKLSPSGDVIGTFRSCSS